jgi:hypothetical protein
MTEEKKNPNQKHKVPEMIQIKIKITKSRQVSKWSLKII